MLPGEVTDDTENSIMVAEMLIANDGKVDPYDFVDRLLNWINKYEEKAMNVCGPSTKRAVSAIKAGEPVEKTGLSGESNGAIMKIVPIGLVNDYHDLPALVEQAYQLCLPTHNTSPAVSGAAAIAAIVSYAVYSDAFDWDEAWRIAIDASELGAKKAHWCWGRSMRAALKNAKRLVDELVAKGTADAEVLNAIFEEVGTGLPCTESGAAAIALAYYANGDPHRAAVLGANIGADTDTVASMAAGICGAISGYESILPEEIKILSQVNGIDFEKLAEGLEAVAN